MGTKYVSLVYQQGEEAYETTSLIESHGEGAGLEHLLSLVSDTTLEHEIDPRSIGDGGDLYDEIPRLAPVGSWQYESTWPLHGTVYVLAYMLAFDAAALYREVPESEIESLSEYRPTDYGQLSDLAEGMDEFDPGYAEFMQGDS